MADEQARTGMVGLFWMVEDRGSAALIAHAVPLAQAVSYGDMLTMEMGHSEYWAQLACRGTRSPRDTGIPTAPVWSEYEEWPRGRVLSTMARRITSLFARIVSSTGRSPYA